MDGADLTPQHVIRIALAPRGPTRFTIGLVGGDGSRGCMYYGQTHTSCSRRFAKGWGGLCKGGWYLLVPPEAPAPSQAPLEMDLWEYLEKGIAHTTTTHS